MTFAERAYQAELDHLVCEDWRHGARDVMPVLPCGGGKTVIFCNMLAREQGASVIIVHRNHLVGQASKTLARNGVRHRVLGSLATQRTCVQLHMADPDIGRSFVDPGAQCAVAGVDTLIGLDARDPWFARVTLVITDEGHHLLRENKWGKARAMFPNARGAAFTATAMRPDGKGLGRHADGMVDSLVQVIEMRDLIRMGYLADYRIFAPPNTLDLSEVGLSAGGDYSPPGVAKAVQKANITGDIVEHYLRIAPGKLGATFAVNIEEATRITQAYRDAGVPAEMITGETPDAMRDSIFRRYRARQVLQLVSVDVLGEGTDVPAMEVISLGRPTASWVTYVQQFCRPLRMHDGKDAAIIIDHVKNVETHAKTRGLPDTPQDYNLDRRERSSSKSKPSDAVPVRTCLNAECMAVYERVLDCCPYCGHVVEPTDRSGPKQVDGVLSELDPDVLRMLRREVARVDGPFHAPASLQGHGATAAARHHRDRQAAQNELRELLALWGGWQESLGRSATEAQRRFYARYNVDALTAAAMGAQDARVLAGHIREQLRANGVHAREAESEGDRIRAWFESMPEGQTSAAYCEANSIPYNARIAGYATKKALGREWESRTLQGRPNRAHWFRIGADPHRHADIKTWFESMPDGQTSKAAALALGVDSYRFGNTCAKALGAGWIRKRHKSNGSVIHGWYRVKDES